MRKGLTLIELMITIVMLVVLAGACVAIFRVVLLSWSAAQKRVGVDINLNRGMEEIIRDLRGSNQVQSSNDEIRFTKDAVSYYIYYLYNAGDPYPPVFNQSSYTLYKAALTGGIGGSFTYGSGQIIIKNVLPPPTSDLSCSGNMATLDISAKKSDETIRLKTQVRPRNL